MRRGEKKKKISLNAIIYRLSMPLWVRGRNGLIFLILGIAWVAFELRTVRWGPLWAQLAFDFQTILNKYSGAEKKLTSNLNDHQNVHVK